MYYDSTKFIFIFLKVFFTPVDHLVPEYYVWLHQCNTESQTISWDDQNLRTFSSHSKFILNFFVIPKAKQHFVDVQEENLLGHKKTLPNMVGFVILTFNEFLYISNT